MGLGIIAGALGGAAEADMRETELENKARQERQTYAANADVAQQRAMALATFQENLKNAPLQRLGSRAQQLAGEEVPLEAAPATELPAYDPADKTGPAAFRGSIEALKRDVMAMPEGPDKQAAIAQLRKQIGEEEKRQQGIVSGATRKRTSDEALTAAADEARVKDLPAYAEYEARIGKPQREERKMDSAAVIAARKLDLDEKRIEAKDRWDATREDRRDERAALLEEGRDRRQQTALLAAEERMRAAGDGKPPTGYRFAADGKKLEYIPGGPADPETPKSKANLTEDQGKATGWLVQAENAWKNMRAVAFDKDGNITSAAKPGVNDVLGNINGLGGVANSMRSDDRQKFMQASSSLTEALLRAATGAGVNMQEAEQKIRELTPEFGDGAPKIKQKMDSIPIYLESLKVRAGPGAVKAAAITGAPASSASAPGGWSIREVK